MGSDGNADESAVGDTGDRRRYDLASKAQRLSHAHPAELESNCLSPRPVDFPFVDRMKSRSMATLPSIRFYPSLSPKAQKLSSTPRVSSPGSSDGEGINASQVRGCRTRWPHRRLPCGSSAAMVTRYQDSAYEPPLLGHHQLVFHAGVDIPGSTGRWNRHQVCSPAGRKNQGFPCARQQPGIAG